MKLRLGYQLAMNIAVGPPRRNDIDRYVRPGMGADARRTARARAMLEDGIHPATRLRTTAAGNCADCRHLLVKQRPMDPTRRWFKCALTLHAGAGPDVRKRWPSCAAWLPTDATQERPGAPHA